jgi:hypothetical protein
VAAKGLYYAMWRQQVGERRESVIPSGEIDQSGRDPLSPFA